MNLSVEDIRHLTRLSKLHFNHDEVDHYLQDLQKIIYYVNKLNNLDLEDILPTSHILSVNNILREDEVRQSMPSSEILKNATDAQEDFFHVPQVVEG